jgi:hypothetical protein
MAEALLVRKGSSENRVYLYKDGVENVAWSGASGNLTEQAGYIQYNNPSNTGTNETLTIATTSTVDLTGYTKLCMEGVFNKTGGTNHTAFNTRLVIGSNEGIHNHVGSNVSRNFEHKWVMSYTGAQTISLKFNCWAQLGYIRISKVWLEK